MPESTHDAEAARATSSPARSPEARVSAGAKRRREEQAEKPMLGRYRLESELGKGAMGVVYLGTDTRSGRTVAIKTLALAPGVGADALSETKDAFFREAQAAGRLAHPNIVAILDTGEARGLAFIALEYLAGGDLVPYTSAPGLLPAGKVLSIVERVAHALDYAHAHGVIHRDIKPANIIYDPDGDIVKVTDFGIARLTEASRARSSAAFGTVAYLSPERIAGVTIDGRSDLFSLGVTLFQLLTGRLPFAGASSAQLMRAITNAPHPRVRDFNPGLPPSIDAIVDKALAKDRAERFETGARFAEALGRVRNGAWHGEADAAS